MTFRKLPKRYAGLVAPLLLSLMMSGIVSAISILRGQGLDSGALELWPSAWAMSWVIAFPVLLVAMPAVRWLTGHLVSA